MHQPRHRAKSAFTASGLFTIGALCAFAVLSGCKSGSAHRQVVGIPKTAIGWLYLSERSGMAEAAYHHGLDLYWNGPSDGDVQQQVSLIEAAVHRDTFGIAINPVSRFTANVAIGDALSHGIPVVVMGHAIPIAPAKHLSFVLEDTRAGAELAAERLKAQLGGSGDVAFVGINPRDAQTLERSEALAAALQRVAPGIHVVDRIVSSQGYGYAEGAVTRLLAEHSNVKAIVSVHDRAGLAAAAALQSFGQKRRVIHLVFDQNLELLALLRRHSIDSIVVQDERAIGRRAVENIVAERAGETVDPLVMMKPQLVTADNIDTEPIQQLLLMNWSRP